MKALRHYDAEGLLEPAYIDPHSGYRYHTVGQVPQATTIALLRSLDLPVAWVRELLTADDENRAALLAAERERLAGEVDRQRRTLDTLDRLARRPPATTSASATGAPSGWPSSAVSSTPTGSTVTPATCAPGWRALGHPPVQAAFVAVYPLDPAEAMDVAVGVPSDGAEPPLDSYALPGGVWAWTLKVGPYAELPLAYSALLGRVTDLGHQATGPVTETYLADPQRTPADELVTALAVHLR